MTSKEIIAKLLREGWSEVTTGGGSHRQFKKVEEVKSHEPGEKPKKVTRRVTVPHPKKDFPIGTLKNIYKQAGWDWSSR